ncbi:MAG: hypothetical protein WCY81_06295 [Sphaerochaetaceae bacterium]
MKKRAILSIFLILVVGLNLFAARVLYSEVIPLFGKIDVSESFSVEYNSLLNFNINSDMAGNTYEIARYRFSSNSLDSIYELKLAPGKDSDGFAFQSTSSSSSSSRASSIPFIVMVDAGQQISSAEQHFIRKELGTNTERMEEGTISIAFPTISEGFDVKAFVEGSYEASIALEVSAD